MAKVMLKAGAKFERIVGTDKDTGKAIREVVVGPKAVEMNDAQQKAFKDLIQKGPSAEELAAIKAAQEESEAKAAAEAKTAADAKAAEEAKLAAEAAEAAKAAAAAKPAVAQAPAAAAKAS